MNLRTALTLPASWLLLAAAALASAPVTGAYRACATPDSQPQAARRTTVSRPAAGFAPLAQWKDAVLSGDKSSLTALYASVPGVIAITPQGKSSDPTEEPTFWSNVRAAGLTALDPKILERKEPQQGMVLLVLRVYLTLRGSANSGDYVISMSQEWAQLGGEWQVVATQRSDPFVKPAIRLPEPSVPNANLYPDPGQAKKDLDAAIAAAAQDHKNVLVDFGGNWCYDCHVLDAAFRSSAIAPILRAHYHVVRVNIGEYDQNLDIAERFQVPLKKGVPELAVLDSKGQLLTSTKQGEFESAVKVGPADITQFLDHWKSASGK